MTENRLARSLVGVQGGYYLLSGAWPLASLATFEAVTGPKTDDWLVHTVGALVIAVGLALLVAARRAVPPAETMTLAIGSAVAFAAIDLVYGTKGTIRPIYLADAVIQVVLVAGLGLAWRRGPREAGT